MFRLNKIINKHLILISALFAAISIIVYSVIPRNPSISKINGVLFDNNYVKVKKLGQIDNLKISYCKHGLLYATEDHYIYKSLDLGESFSSLGHFNKINPSIIDFFKDVIARLRIIRDIRQNIGCKKIVVLSTGTILAFYDHIYRSTDGGHSFHSCFTFGDSIHGPFCNGIAVDKEDNVFFGEYNCTKRPHRIRIFRGTDDGKNWKVCYEFPKGKIFHIHSIKYDPYRDRLWICTGDSDNESYLFFTDDDFETLQLLGGGDQHWRICSLIVTDKFLYWGSDDDQFGSSIWRYDFEKQRREKILLLGKPCYHSNQLKDGTLVLSTTYEPESTFTEKYKPNPSTDIWISKNGLNWFKIVEIPHKDFLTPYGRSRAQIFFAAGDNSTTYLFFTPINTIDNHFTLQKYHIKWKNKS